jgi:outer membrane protein assembly factor BamB
VVWEAPLARADRGPYADVDTTPVHVQRGGLVPGAGGDWLLAASHSGGLHALRAADGAVVWRDDGAGVAEIACDGAEVLVVGSGPRLHVIEVHSGRAVVVRDLSAGAGGRVALLGPTWAAIAGESGLDLVARRTGRMWSRFALEAGFAQPPVIAGGRLLAVSNAGVVYGLQLSAVAH